MPMSSSFTFRFLIYSDPVVSAINASRTAMNRAAKGDTLLNEGEIMEESKNVTQPGDIARREFVALSVAAGLAAPADAAPNG